MKPFYNNVCKSLFIRSSQGEDEMLLLQFLELQESKKSSLDQRKPWNKPTLGICCEY